MGSATRPVERRLPPLRLNDELNRLAPSWSLLELGEWPPDAFAFTAAVLADSGAYRCVVSPAAGHVWLPAGAPLAEWEAELRREAARWAAAAGEYLSGPKGLPGPVQRLLESLAGAGDVPLAELDQQEHCEVLGDLLRLHALADEASSGAGIQEETPFLRRAAALLAANGSLARLPVDRGRVLPKLRPPASGITLRSLSHHLALDRSEVASRWIVAPPSARSAGAPDRLTLLLVPHPSVIRVSDFVPVTGLLPQMGEGTSGFYEFAPQERLGVTEAVRLIERARRYVGDIDVLVLPEGAVDETEKPRLQRLLVDAGVPYLIAGVRRRAGQGERFGGNYAYCASGEWEAPPQHKHHRWCLDGGQVHQYQLGAALDPRRRWWEAIDVPPRSLTFVTISEGLTICPLVCEDLARPDPVADVIRSIAPTLVVALLLDGPQLAARWPARYASVLADDPGCAVLTLTALGMTQRCQPPGLSPSRGVALWKDPYRGFQEIALADGARAVALTAHARDTSVRSADGRTGKHAVGLVLSGIEQIG